MLEGHSLPPVKQCSKFKQGDRYYFRVGDDIKEVKCTGIYKHVTCFDAGVIALVNDKWVDHKTASRGAIYKHSGSVFFPTSTSLDGHDVATGTINNTHVEIWSTRKCPDDYEDGPWCPLGRSEQLLGVIYRGENQLAEYKH